jgi:hypothetical protein
MAFHARVRIGEHVHASSRRGASRRGASRRVASWSVASCCFVAHRVVSFRGVSWSVASRRGTCLGVRLARGAQETTQPKNNAPRVPFDTRRVPLFGLMRFPAPESYPVPSMVREAHHPRPSEKSHVQASPNVSL